MDKFVYTVDLREHYTEAINQAIEALGVEASELCVVADLTDKAMLKITATVGQEEQS